MTRIGIVGGGRGATLHAEAARAVRGVDLVGVGGRDPGTATELAAAVGVPDLAIPALIATADALVVAVPPAAVDRVVERIPDDMPLLVECPSDAVADRTAAVAAINLLHAPVVTKGLAEIARLGHVHHLVLRGSGPRPDWGDHGSAAWGGGVVIDPHASTLPVLFAAAGAPADATKAELDGPPGLEHRARLTFRLPDDRQATAELAWDSTPATAEIEAASDRGVVTLRLLPVPELEIDGRVALRDEAPGLGPLGFLRQMERFAGVVRGDRSPWPPAAVGASIRHLTDAD
ncbi:MAG: NAD(P)-binding domain-containing protein [Actinomycetota bacterium]